MKLTDMQVLILIAISEYIYDNEKPPTIRNIAYDLEKSPSTIYFHLSKMKESKLIKFNDKGQIEAICQK
jgi:DNA-binding transcriptional ArsR family regulator